MRTEGATEKEKEDKAFIAEQTVGFPDADIVAAVAREQLRRAGQEPNRGWPAYARTLPMGDPTAVIRDPRGRSNGRMSTVHCPRNVDGFTVQISNPLRRR